MTLLNERIIRQCLAKTAYPAYKSIDFHILTSIDSTQRFIKTEAHPSYLAVCCAEAQTNGQGRFGRAWHSPFGENIYCSIRKRIKTNLSALSGLGLVISMAIYRAIESITNAQSMFIKWPNDILWNDQKLSGNLIDVLPVASEPKALDVIMGIGLNVNSTDRGESAIERPWCSLYDITGKQHDRNALIAQLIFQVEQHLETFIDHGLRSFMPIWNTMDYLFHQRVIVSHANQFIHGCAQGITEQGLLMVRDDNGVLHCLSSGEASIVKYTVHDKNHKT